MWCEWLESAQPGRCRRAPANVPSQSNLPRFVLTELYFGVVFSGSISTVGRNLGLIAGNESLTNEEYLPKPMLQDWYSPPRVRTLTAFGINLTLYLRNNRRRVE